LGVEFTKNYRDAGDEPLGRVVWDMVFVEHALVEQRSPDAETVPAQPDDPRRRNGAAPRSGEPIGRYSRTFDMEALVRWSAAIWDLGLPHVDPEYARRVYGLPHVVAHGPFINASLARLVTDWMDRGDRVVAHRGRFRRPVVGNDRLMLSGVVAEVRAAAAGTVSEIEAVATNQYGEIVAESRTVCALAG
ncbi:MAG TPA: MaoC/PaaZ C-terminal domain-containing protein, partial [Solirubrobacterales bacterium]|nr:MaoC/PaaZ C-terminal domain-containing protein [Solirubrobacterales bacterium]